MSVLRVVITVGLLVAVAGCAAGGGKPIGLVGQIEPVDGNKLPPPLPQDNATFERSYRIGPFDKLEIDVFGVEELSNKKVQVDASGRLSFPLVGTVEAAGRTPNELAMTIQEGLQGRFIKSPQVTANLIETISQVVTVDGEVREPGLYPVVGRMTLMRAVATAKGATEYSQLSNVVVFRTVNGKDYAALYNLKAIRRGNYEDPEIFANDVVVVGDNQTRRIFKDLIQGSSFITTPLIYLITRN